MKIHVSPSLDDNYISIAYVDTIAIAVDPGDAGPVLDFVKSRALKLGAVFITHHHGDHTAGAAELKKKTGCIVYGPPGGIVDKAVDDGDVLKVGPIEARAVHTPGHTQNDMSYHIPAANAVFTGDTMFVCGCGRLLGGTASQLYQSLMRIVTLGDRVNMYCGHEYTEENLAFALSIDPGNAPVAHRLEEVMQLRRSGAPSVPSAIALEKQTNPFLRASEPAMKQALGMANAGDLAVFTELRRRKDRF